MTDLISRQQRRRIVREQIRSGERLADTGLAATPTRAQMRDVARALHAKLTETRNPRRASEAAQLAQTLMDTSLRRYPGTAAIACKKGCAYCCSSYVVVTAPEVFRIAELVRAGKASGASAADVRVRAVALRDLGPRERVGAKLACPLLVGTDCSVYSSRPLTCRQATSLSVAACIEEYENTGDPDGRIQISSAHLAHSGNASVALLVAMVAAGLSTQPLELSAALAAVLDDADAEERWLAGEAVFDSLPRRDVRAPHIDRVAQMIAADLGS